MNRFTYTVKGFALLAKRVICGKNLPYHAKVLTISEQLKPENKKYLHNGILRTAKGIIKGECRLHWLREC